MRIGLFAAAGTGLAGLVLLTATILWIWPELPEVGILQDIHLQQPLRIYSADGVLLGEYGSKFRQPVDLDSIPRHVINAFLASEDSRFLEHSGVDFIGLARAAAVALSTLRFSQGASTITMQVARNYFLNREKTLARKLRELLLAIKIERELSKQQILELYLNRIFFGHRAYGIEAAAQVYYGKKSSELSIAEAAMIAGLPQRPSRDNPIRNPQKSLERRNYYVLPRMRELEMISEAQLREALDTPETARLHAREALDSAAYFVEMVRLFLAEKYDELFFESGHRVYTTLNSRYQTYAARALREGVQNYEIRHAWNGRIGHIDDYSGPGQKLSVLEVLRALSEQQPLPVDLRYAVVSDAAQDLNLTTSDAVAHTLDADALKPVLSVTRTPAAELAKLLPPGSVVIVQISDKGGARLAQLPGAQAALYSMDPRTGAIRAMVGGYGLVDDHFNRATQAQRQVGSLFKPFLYSVALANGYNLSTVINDTNITFDDAVLEEEWRPSNYSNRVFGPTLLRDALVHSRNLVSIRLLEDLGIPKVRRWMRKFGYDDPRQIPKNLTMALGSGVFSPEQISTGLAVLANGGYLTEPWFIERIENVQNQVIYRQDYTVACLPCVRDILESADIEIIAASEQNEDSIGQAGGVADTGGAQDNSPLAPDAELAVSRVDLLKSREETFLRVDEIDASERVVHRVREAGQTLDPRLALMVSSMMNDVVRRGTGARVYRALKRADLYGKTGTTNDNRDVWFAGFHPHLLTTVWVGRDDNSSLGRREAGGRTALPIWAEYMRFILPELEFTQMSPTDGVQLRRVSRKTGQITHADDKDSYFEYFLEENLTAVESNGGGNGGDGVQSKALKELF